MATAAQLGLIVSSLEVLPLRGALNAPLTTGSPLCSPARPSLFKPPPPFLLLPLQSPYHCNLLLAGWDEQAGASLYWMDYLATLNKINTGGTGYGKTAKGKEGETVCGYGCGCRRGNGCLQ